MTQRWIRFSGNTLAVHQAVIYGSRTKGNYRDGSDTGITLKTGDSFTFTELLRISGGLDNSDMPYLVDVALYHELSNPGLPAHIDKVGKILFTRGD